MWKDTKSESERSPVISCVILSKGHVVYRPEIRLGSPRRKPRSILEQETMDRIKHVFISLTVIPSYFCLGQHLKKDNVSNAIRFGR